MFGFGKKKKQEKKKSTIDKLIMGAIVGGAVGSVIGMTIAPQKGKETREMIAQKGKELIEKGQEIKKKMDEAHEQKDVESDELVEEHRHHKKSIMAKMADRVFGRSKKVKKEIMKEEKLKKIPNEVE